eukprot:COSAG02_NODE_12347_length_1559_cov_1.928767_1_plen_29_part_10
MTRGFLSHGHDSIPGLLVRLPEPGNVAKN